MITPRTLTDDQLTRLNHLRERAGKVPVSKEQAEAWLKFWPDSEYKELLDRIGS